MRQWEDLRANTGFWDWAAEFFADPDEIREEADRYYNATSDHYADALRVEGEARKDCLAEIRVAFHSLPDFRGGDFVDATQLQGGVDALRRETKDAADDPHAQLFGTGAKTDSISQGRSDVAISPALLRIKLKTAGLEADGNYHWLPSDSDDERREYIFTNKHLLRNAARDSGLPPEMVAGIAWKEVEGDPSWTDDAFPWARRNLPFTGDQDMTSLGPMSIQVRRAAEVLGYDPENLSDQQRDEVTGALKDPAQNVYIASEYLAQLKAESELRRRRARKDDPGADAGARRALQRRPLLSERRGPTVRSPIRRPCWSCEGSTRKVTTPTHPRSPRGGLRIGTVLGACLLPTIEAPLAFVTLVQLMPRGDDAVEFDAAQEFTLLSNLGIGWAILCLALTLPSSKREGSGPGGTRLPSPCSRRWRCGCSSSRPTAADLI